MRGTIKVIVASDVEELEDLLSQLSNQDEILTHSIDRNGVHYVIVKISSRLV